ncbi:heavy metal translocating P-type ATPase [Halomonas ramblicola]|uniref:heavy metal translocating P-type ATPase n=1 Tax=Halomonas ramblicola TaxID=747349 RepID=UPI0025B3C0AE|nr:heavy metal translocating P-type ATPase [Halomonas ramblicola]MDN3521608.1 heavy metal translocating P-type ATPase [Halomonas ramblicola]
MSRHDTASSCCGAPGAEATPKTTPPPADADALRLRIQEMCCPTEEGLLRKALADRPGVQALEFDLVNQVLTVHHRDADPQALQARIRELGMTPTPLDATAASSDTPAPARRERWWPLVLAALIALGAEASHWFAPGPEWPAAVLALVAIAMVGLPTWRKGLVALRHRTLNINALMSVAVTGALLIGHWAEAAMVLVLFTLAERLEARSMERARHAIRDLLALAPQQARVQKACGDWHEVPASQVAVGSLVRVRPGERVALDGEVARGQPVLDESPITGESLPRDKAMGDNVFAGTINRDGEFDYRTTRVADDTTLARIIHAVERAQASRAPTQRLVDRFAAVYTPAVFALAIATALAWPLLFGGAWLEGVYRGLVLLVIACPCALVISTPVTIVSGLSAAARAGILIKGGSFLERGHRLAWVALDKTGTLTRGEPRQRHWRPLAEATDAERRRLQASAASLAARSNHPVSRALWRAAEDAGIAAGEVEAFTELPGRGVQGEIDGATWWLGNRRLAAEFGLDTPDLAPHLDAAEGDGQGLVLLGDAQRVLALFTVTDPLKATAREAVAALHALGVKTLMLSGDNAASVAAIAREAGIDEARGELLPEDKLAAIEARARQGVVGMVGDGINDAPALARADIGFAMGAAGSDAAIETADVALMDDDPRKLPAFVALSRRTYRVLQQNIALAIGIKLVFLLLALTGHATLWMAVFADMGSSLLVVANGMRLLRAAPAPRSAEVSPGVATASAGS